MASEADRIDLAWWTCVAEPADPYAAALIAALGPAAARDWAEAPRPRPLPAELEGPGRRWDEAHARWAPRVLSAEVEGELAGLEELGGRFIIPSHAGWPAALDDLGALRPLGLWAIGELPTRSASIVGSRAATGAGERNAFDLAAGLAEAGVATCSGGAFGIDIAAHRGCRAGGAPTLAVMAGGLGQPYPAAHRDEFARIIAEGGALVSESPTSWRPAKWRFLTRNRIIAAWSPVTVVVEASTRSGALATARRAMELGREVAAMPGPLASSASGGCHELIRNSATLVRDAEDVLELLEPFSARGQGVLFGSPVAPDAGADALAPVPRRVFEALPKRSSARLTGIARSAGLSEKEVLTALAELELAGMVVSDTRGWARRT